MATLSSLISRHPILEALLPKLPLAGLLNLAKLNSEYRCILHGFPPCYERHEAEDFKVRPSLHIGKHQTQTWSHRKSMCQLQCSEPHHTKGTNVRLCRACSMPVCEACIVKKSFNKKENKFNNRRRYVCKDCWHVARPQARQSRYQAYESVLLDHDSDEICHCTPKDAILCLSCKDGQSQDVEKQIDRCTGFGCSMVLTAENIGGSYCLWCNLMVAKASTPEQCRRLFNSRYQPQHQCTYAQIIGMKRSLGHPHDDHDEKRLRNSEDSHRVKSSNDLGATPIHPTITRTLIPFDENCVIVNRRDNEATQASSALQEAANIPEIHRPPKSIQTQPSLDDQDDDEYTLVEVDSQPESPRTIVGDAAPDPQEDWEFVTHDDDSSRSVTAS